jgi:prevent-host-death family protein
MTEIGVRELKQNTSEIIRRVREKKEAFNVTYRGRVVAWLVPIETPDEPEDWRAVWADMEETAARIGKSWRSERSAAEAVSDQRR